MPLILDQAVTLNHINIRKEGPDDEKHLMVDLKFECITSSALLLEFDPALRSMLFHESAPRFPKMAPVRWGGEMRHMELEIAGVEFLDVTLRKFQIEPMSIPGEEYVTLVFVATFAPGGRETAIIAEQVGEKCEIKLRPGRELDLAPGDAAAVRASVRKLHDQLVENSASLTITGPDGNGVTLNGQDALYQQAVEVVRSGGKTSISYLQRTLKIGYNRAARLIEDMEKAGVVTSMDAAGQRDLVGAMQ